MKLLLIINDAPYGTEKAYNALRIANQTNKDYPDTEVNIFLMADAVSCAIANQLTPNGFYNIERMLKFSLNKGANIKLCGSCMDARGLKLDYMVEGATRSTMAELTRLIIESTQVLTF
ncbi:DsrE family protein [uncultured Planktosalinus sp.]|uniref:DsrE/DsrF/TusD sulfur relay family protein n=1 Tax=uncultured Planktosalinus sp. TaxID=1810935 RepID=UPI0030D96A4B